MRAIFSCAAYKNFDEVKSKCKQLELAVNDHLKDKKYGQIHFLTPRFSFISLVESEAPIILDQNNLSLTIAVDGSHISQIASALIEGLNSESVPKNLRKDIAATFKINGWIN